MNFLATTMKQEQMRFTLPMSALLLISTVILLGSIPVCAETLSIIGSNDCLLGGVKNGQWVKEEKIWPEVKNARKYRFYTWNGPVNKPMKTLKIEFEDGEFYLASPLQESEVEKWAERDNKTRTIGISSEKNIMPSIPRVLDVKNQKYINIVDEELKKKGIKTPKVDINQGYAVDLDGDGSDEVILSATHYTSDITYPAKSGDYSAVFLLKTVDGQIKSTMISGEFYPRNQKEYSDDPPVNIHEVVAVTDLNSDGHLEIIVESSYYAGSEVYVFGIVDGKVSKHLECFIGT